MKLKALSTQNDYEDFYQPILTLDKKTGLGRWAEGANIQVYCEVQFGQTFTKGNTTILWEKSETPFLRDFSLSEDALAIWRNGSYEVNISLFCKGEVGDILQINLQANGQPTGLKTVGTINAEGCLHLQMKGILKVDKKTKLQVILQKSTASSTRLLCAASFLLFQKINKRSWTNPVAKEK